MITKLESGKAYIVKIRGHRNRRRRVFKWMEERFGQDGIPCYVFSAPVKAGVRAEADPVRQSLSWNHADFPKSEWSVPEYDLLEATPA